MQRLKEGYKLIDGQLSLTKDSVQGGHDWSSAFWHGGGNRSPARTPLASQGTSSSPRVQGNRAGDCCRAESGTAVLIHLAEEVLGRDDHVIAERLE
jgi:hypothetical protein